MINALSNQVIFLRDFNSKHKQFGCVKPNKSGQALVNIARDLKLIYVNPGGGVMPYMCHTERCCQSRVYVLALESETGCLFSSFTLKQSAKFVRSLRARVPIHSTVWHPPIGFNLFLFCPGN